MLVVVVAGGSSIHGGGSGEYCSNLTKKHYTFQANIPLQTVEKKRKKKERKINMELKSK